MPTRKPNVNNLNSQNISMGNVNMKGSNLNIEQNMRSEFENKQITTANDFAVEIEHAIDILQKLRGTSSSIDDVLDDLKEARKEVKKTTPSSSKIRRFLNDARSILNEISGGVKDVSTIVTIVTGLVNLVPAIFH